MGVMMQAFYWDCPRHDNQEFTWWDAVRARVPELHQAGITSLWLPPPFKAGNIGGQSMGYDPYDYFDLGEFDQKGGIPTWFGTKGALTSLINSAHDHSIQVIADIVLNHNNGADEEEYNPILKEKRWTKFNPKSGKFPRDWKSFHPSPYDQADNMSFGGMPDLCHRNPQVYEGMFDVAKMLIQDMGFDGFRFDFVKGYGAWLIQAIMEYRYMRNGELFRPYGVGELWASEWDIDVWLTEVNSYSDNLADVYDFPLHYKLRHLCNSYGYDLRNFVRNDTIFRDRPFQAVSFVDNHDTEREWSANDIKTKLMAYAFILTHEGYPCVFWKDYFNAKLAGTGTANGIEALIQAHEHYAGGSTYILRAEKDVYIMQRNGSSEHPGLLLVLNNRGDDWNGGEIQTNWHNRKLEPIAWGGLHDDSKPFEKHSDSFGKTSLFAAPRGYAVYVPRD
jgi:alpha-amylase